MKNFFKYLFAFFLVTAPALLCAQTIRYVTYFPVPHVYYPSFSVNSTALLATRGVNLVKDVQNKYPSGKVTVGDSSNNASLTVGSFAAENNIIFRSSGETEINTMKVGTNFSHSTYVSSVFGGGNNITVTGAVSPGVLRAFGNLEVASLSWDYITGAIGNGMSSLPASCSLQWKKLKLNGTSEYLTYLICI
jgi:hypothetical protein